MIDQINNAIFQSFQNLDRDSLTDWIQIIVSAAGMVFLAITIYLQRKTINLQSQEISHSQAILRFSIMPRFYAVNGGDDNEGNSTMRVIVNKNEAKDVNFISLFDNLIIEGWIPRSFVYDRGPNSDPDMQDFLLIGAREMNRLNQVDMLQIDFSDIHGNRYSQKITLTGRAFNSTEPQLIKRFST